MKQKMGIVILVLMLLLGAAQAEWEIDMLAVDHRLYELGYRDGACNGILDEVTVNALKNFQKANGLEPTGEPDGNTVGLLLSNVAVDMEGYLSAMSREYMEKSALANGSYGNEVSRLQKELKALGYFSGSSDGAYGNETEDAVYRFQLANGLRETGIADGAVFLRLYMGEPVSWERFIEESCVTVGDTGSRVRTLQLWLKNKGYFHGECTGRYGDGTQQAVKRFQADNGLEPSGDMDMDACRMLYSDVDDLLRESSALRRGESGAEVEALCRDLAALGYPVHGRFNMQTELALMQFQLVNRLSVTGVADEVTLARLRSEGAVPLSDYEFPLDVAPEDELLRAKASRLATSLLGRLSEFDTDFGFVQYVYLKCGTKLMDRSQISPVGLGAADTLEAGTILAVELDGREICGIAAADRAMIHRSDNGYIVMSYLETLGADNVYIYRILDEA